jgi:hypothetical protein
MTIRSRLAVSTFQYALLLCVAFLSADVGFTEDSGLAARNIRVAFQKDSNGSTLAPADFAPLVTPTSSLISQIEKTDGPHIPPSSIVGAIATFPLVRLNSRATLYAAMVFESSDEPSHASALQSRRISELQDLFARFHASPPEQVRALLQGPATAAAATLVMSILDGATAYAEGGPNLVRANGVSIGYLPIE